MSKIKQCFSCQKLESEALLQKICLQFTKSRKQIVLLCEEREKRLKANDIFEETKDDVNLN